MIAFGGLVQKICVAVNATTNSTNTVSSATSITTPTGSYTILPIPYNPANRAGLNVGFGGSGVVLLATMALLGSLL